MSTEAHRARIMAHFRKGLSLTHRESQKLFNKDRLAARICELRKQGHHIECVMEPNGNGGNHGRYSLIKERTQSSKRKLTPGKEAENG